MTLRRPAAVLLAVAGIVVPAGAAHGARLTAALSADQVVPPAPGVPFAAAATFHGTLTRDRHLTWRLQSSGTTGPVTAARVHLGRRGTAGPAVLTLCAPCATRARGTVARAAPRVASALRTGRAHIQVETAANPAGELRGAVVIAVRAPLRQLPTHPARTQTRGMRVLSALLDDDRMDWDLILQGIASPVTRAEIRDGGATVRVLCTPCGAIRSGSWRLDGNRARLLRSGRLSVWVATRADPAGYSGAAIAID